jgi:peptide/nickel transport system permease protein
MVRAGSVNIMTPKETLSRKTIILRLFSQWCTRTGVVLLFMSGFVMLLCVAFEQVSVSDLTDNLFSAKLFDELTETSLTSFKLIGAGLLLSLALSWLIGWFEGVKGGGRWVMVWVTIFSAVPVFLYAAIAHAKSQTHFLWGVLILGIGNLSLSVLTRRISAGLHNELSSLYISTARVKHVPLWMHYWRPLLVHILTTTRPMIPYYVSAAVVVEWKFQINGLGDLAYASAENSELAPVIWICVIVVFLVRLLQLANELVILSLIPQRRIVEEVRTPLRDRMRVWFRQRQNASPKPKHVTSTPLKAAIDRRLQTTTLEQQPNRNLWKLDFIRRLDPLSTGLLLLITLLFALSIVDATFGVWEYRNQLSRSMEPAKLGFSADLLGRDISGRSVFAGLLKGAIPYTLPLLIGVLVATVFGILLAAFSASQPKSALTEGVDAFIEMLDALPKLIVLLMVVSLTSTQAYHYKMMCIMGFLFIPEIYHSVRERILYFQQSGFVEAERALGASGWRIVFGHILWNNCRDVLFVQLAHIWGSLIVLDATLAYLELNQPDYPTWGSLVKAGYKYIQYPEAHANPFVYIAPTAAIVLTLVAVNLTSETAYVGMKGRQ